MDDKDETLLLLCGAPQSLGSDACGEKVDMDFEGLLQRFYERLLRPGDNALDVGAHSGRHAVPMAKVVSANAMGGRVYAFEPIPRVREYFLQRMRDEAIPEDVVQLLPFALSDHDGHAEFVVALDRPEESGLKVRIYNGPTRLERIAVQTRSLDGLALPIDSLRFIKVDCEGAEYSVLKGAKQTIVRFRPVIAFEFGLNSCLAYGIQPKDMFGLVECNGYKVFDILGNELSCASFVQTCESGRVWDFVATPREQLPGVGQLLDPGVA